MICLEDKWIKATLRIIICEDTIHFSSVLGLFPMSQTIAHSSKEWGIEKWTGLRGHNSRSKAARAKRSSPAESL